MPAKGEKLEIGDISQLTSDARVQKALRRISADKAPQNVAQLVMWSVASKLDWETIAQMSKKWANAHELSLAWEFVAAARHLARGRVGHVARRDPGGGRRRRRWPQATWGKLLEGQYVLGLPVKIGVPEKPTGPTVACRIQVIGTAEKPEAQVRGVANERWRRRPRGRPSASSPSPVERADGIA